MEEKMEKKKNFNKVLIILLIIGLVLGISFWNAAATNRSAPQTNSGNFLNYPKSFSELADKVRPGVVNIRTIKTIKGGGPVFRHFFGNPYGNKNPHEEFFGPFENRIPQPDYKQRSLGSTA